MYRKSITNPEKFWAKEAGELEWQAAVDKSSQPGARRSRNGLSAASSTFRKIVSIGILTGRRRNKAAIIWEGEPGDKRTLTYQQLHREVCRFANVLKRNKIRQRRSRHHLYADNSGGGDRHARLCAHWRGALGRVRRIQRGQHSRSHRGLRRDRGDHGGWRLSARRDRSVKEQCR